MSKQITFFLRGEFIRFQLGKDGEVFTFCGVEDFQNLAQYLSDDLNESYPGYANQLAQREQNLCYALSELLHRFRNEMLVTIGLP